jgi:hypothetical protein
MGIRFSCPTCGRKLNVKSFLAGKRGVCPHCGSGLNIPLQDSADPPIEDPDDPGGLTVRSVSPVAPGPVHSPRPGDKLTVSGNVVPSVPVAKPIATPAPREARPGSPEARPGPRQAIPLPARATGSVPRVPTAGPVSSPGAAVRVQPPLPGSAASQPAPIDPIDEAPEAVWYVRPPSGGQYGPARGDVMRKWISEGRVSGESMVWREGWQDWRDGGEVFPRLRTVTTPAMPAPVAYAPSTPSSPRNSRGYPARRRSNSLALAITTVVVLGLMSIALLVTLLLVINRS